MLTCISNGIWLVAPRVPRYPYANCLYIEDERPTVIDLGAGGNAFADGDEIQTGKNTIKAIHLPGHSAGHYGFYFEKENILFSADIDLVRTGPWYNSNSGNVGDLIASVQKIKEINPCIIVPSHRRIQSENLCVFAVRPYHR